ncbi:hypothetical protein C8Q80DRAFT_92182 [Daedaleopsis nitida]|nr:hypothetical protein C8Q80DRAFT_92182 [Daedaleopsis nitida]
MPVTLPSFVSTLCPCSYLLVSLSGILWNSLMLWVHVDSAPVMAAPQSAVRVHQVHRRCTELQYPTTPTRSCDERTCSLAVLVSMNVNGPASVYRCSCIVHGDGCANCQCHCPAADIPQRPSPICTPIRNLCLRGKRTWHVIHSLLRQCCGLIVLHMFLRLYLCTYIPPAAPMCRLLRSSCRRSTSAYLSSISCCGTGGRSNQHLRVRRALQSPNTEHEFYLTTA